MRTLSFLVLLLTTAIPVIARHGAESRAFAQFFPRGECAPDAFYIAWKGYHNMLRDSLLGVPQYLTIIDYSQPSHRPRMFVLNVPAGKVEISSIVAHGLGSDPDSSGIPVRFSNREGSRMSSIGFFLTGDVYVNFRPGDSLGLCLFGLDGGINDSAAAREIVLHYGATEYSGRVYVTDSGAARSYGCPALPLSTNSRVINKIRGGSLLFIYSAIESANFRHRSTVLRDKLSLPIIQRGPPPNNCSCLLQRR